MDVVKVVLFASLYGFYEKRTVVPRWFFLILRVRGAFFSTSPWLWHEKVGESFIARKSKSKSKSKSKGCREL